MATLVPTITDYGNHTKTFSWGPLTSTNTEGHPIPGIYADYSDRSVQIAGTFGAGTVVFEGSNDGTNYATLTDPQGNAISKTSAALEQVTEAALLAKPRVSGADGATSVTVTVIARRSRGGMEV